MFQIEDLLKTEKYDIYNNSNITDADIEVIAQAIMKDAGVNIDDLFNLTKCSSKFCWFNFLRILEKIPAEVRVKGLPVLFELLQDANWPTYEKTVELIKAMPKSQVEPYYNDYLELAYKEDDEMWISNLKDVAKGLDIEVS